MFCVNVSALPLSSYINKPLSKIGVSRMDRKGRPSDIQGSFNKFPHKIPTSRLEKHFPPESVHRLM